MLDITLFRTDPERIRSALRARNMDPSPVDDVLSLDERRRVIIQEAENLKAERNRVSKEISRMKDPAERAAQIEAMRMVGNRIAELDETQREVERKLQDVMAMMPNLPDPRVPPGVSEEDNVVLRTEGSLPSFDFQPKAHWDLGPALGIIDFERGTKLAGSRFYILNGPGARLVRALIAFMLDLHIRQGYEERYLPFMVKTEVVYGAGQLPKFAENLYKDHEEDFYMVPTAEIPLTGLHMDEILEDRVLPLRYTAYTPCFRRERMSAGRDVRGIKRGHQFDKVEMYALARPEESEAELQRMLASAEETLALLGLPYRIHQLCTGDLGFGAEITYDIEAWAAGCQEWLEVSSVSNDGDFQARRASIRYRPENGRVQFLHTLNGSGLGVPRTLIAVLENYQQADGSVVIPDALRPWMGGLDVIRPA